MRRTAISGLAVAFTIGLGIAPAAAAAADHAGPSRGASEDHRAQRDAQVAPTEDTDSNDGGTPNGVVDSGDDQHPSGRDRSVEPGGSGNQGNTSADPDDDGRGPDRSNGGTDVPDGVGGFDKADQDRNNGCGNDDDFEDDNEGWCGHHPRPDHADEHRGETDAVDHEVDTTGHVAARDAQVARATGHVPTPTGTVDEGEVLGLELERTAPSAAAVRAASSSAPARAALADVGAADVGAAEVAATSAPSGTLPFTGFELVPLAMVGAGLVGAGVVLRRRAARA